MELQGGKNPLISQNFSDESNKIGFSFSFSTKGGGKTIQFHRVVVNEFLGNPLVLQEGKLCRYQESINTVPNVEEYSKKFLLDGREVERNPYGATIRYRREDLILEAQFFLLFILHNIRSRSHTCTFIMDTTQLLYLIMSESGKEFGIGIRSTCPLVFPGLIMELLIVSRVRILNMVKFEIKTKVNDIYVDRFYLDKKKKRRQVELHIQPRGQPDAGHHFMTPEEFQTQIAWPGDMPFYQGEAAGHEDENDEEDAEAEIENEEGTSGGSKIAPGDDEETRGE
ncbi:hypothetical protein KIW84_053443 [Lathyrus oleraceus]|uniref:Uncharacterized protein n=1 Tax=Pisum sativum TaxID=3888 RepID=A0A9D4WT82_PEA|nr:hypothetical protein KIW84_053443 [Pisum sativum]